MKPPTRFRDADSDASSEVRELFRRARSPARMSDTEKQIADAAMARIVATPIVHSLPWFLGKIPIGLATLGVAALIAGILRAKSGHGAPSSASIETPSARPPSLVVAQKATPPVATMLEPAAKPAQVTETVGSIAISPTHTTTAVRSASRPSTRTSARSSGHGPSGVVATTTTRPTSPTIPVAVVAPVVATAETSRVESSNTASSPATHDPVSIMNMGAMTNVGSGGGNYHIGHVESVATANPTEEAAEPLEQETQALGAARQLVESAPATALARLATFDRQFPHPQLQAQRYFIGMLALRKLGRISEARELGELLLTRYPHSMQAPRTRNILEELR